MKRDGFTLLEILVSVSVLAMVGVLLTQVFVSTIQTNSRGEVTRLVKQNGDYAIRIMSRMIQNAVDVTSTCTTGGYTADAVMIKNPDYNVSTFTCLEDTDNKIFRIASPSGTENNYMTGTGVTLAAADCAGAMSFTCLINPDGGKSVSILFTLKQKSASTLKSDQSTQKFETTVKLRNL